MKFAKLYTNPNILILNLPPQTMIFNKKKDKMIDVRELAKRGIVNLSRPENEDPVPTDKEGFVEISALQPETKPSSNSNADFFNFTKTTSEQETFSNSTDGYNKREVDAKIVDLDNKIYKLEQRIELLERKVGVNQPTENGGLIGW